MATDRTRLRRLCAAQRDMPSEVVLALLDQLEAAEATLAKGGDTGPVLNPDKFSIMFGWLVYDVGEHTCGGYGPESGYLHEPGCGFEPMVRLDTLPGWPGEPPATVTVISASVILDVGTLLAAGAICETSRTPGGPRIAAKLYEAARNGHRIDAGAVSVPTEAPTPDRPAESIVSQAHYGRMDG